MEEDTIRFHGAAGLGLLLMVALLIIHPGAAVYPATGNFTRPNASEATPIPTLDDTLYDHLLIAMQPGGNVTNVSKTTDVLPDIPDVLYIAMSAYTDVWGNTALVILFAIPFLMAWIMGGNVTLPSVMGIITGGFILYRLPEQYQLVAIGFIVMSVIAIIYSLLKEPR